VTQIRCSDTENIHNFCSEPVSYQYVSSTITNDIEIVNMSNDRRRQKVNISGVARKFELGGLATLFLPYFPFLLLSYSPVPFPRFPFPARYSPPLAPLRSRIFKFQLKSVGKRCELTGGICNGEPPEIKFGALWL